MMGILVIGLISHCTGKKFLGVQNNPTTQRRVLIPLPWLRSQKSKKAKRQCFAVPAFGF
jgi:hypothetical protein